jgi:hypothetical protein
MSSSRMNRLDSLSVPLRSIAAVLVVALLVGGFVAVLYQRGGLQNGAAPTPAATTPPAATATHAATATPTSHAACTSAPGDTAHIQDGGYGADLGTFTQRWGASDGVAAGSVYFGRWADGMPKVQVADAVPSNHRVYHMSYLVDTAQEMTQAQAETLATALLPKDATLTERTQQGSDFTVTYCSASLIAAFPTSVREINGPLPHNGLVVVTYTHRTDGQLFGIVFAPLP